MTAEQLQVMSQGIGFEVDDIFESELRRRTLFLLARKAYPSLLSANEN